MSRFLCWLNLDFPNFGFSACWLCFSVDDLVTKAMVVSLIALCFPPGLSVKAPMEMWSTSSSEKFYRIPEGKGPHSVGCTDLMTENAVEVNLSTLSPLDLSHNVSELAAVLQINQPEGRACVLHADTHS